MKNNVKMNADVKSTFSFFQKVEIKGRKKKDVKGGSKNEIIIDDVIQG